MGAGGRCDGSWLEAIGRLRCAGGRKGLKTMVVPFPHAMRPVSSGFELGREQRQVAVVRPRGGRRKHPLRYSMAWVPACEKRRAARSAVFVRVIIAERDTLLRHPGERGATDLRVHVQRRRADIVISHVVHHDEDHVRSWWHEGRGASSSSGAEQNHHEQQQQSKAPHLLSPLSSAGTPGPAAAELLLLQHSVPAAAAAARLPSSPASASRACFNPRARRARPPASALN